MGNVHSHEIIQEIKNALFLPETRRLQGWIDQIAQKNKTASDNKDPLGFWFDGRYFKPSWLTIGKYRKVALHEALHSEMEDFIKDQKSVNDDQQYISQTLFALIEPCETYQDIRDTLPDCLVEVVPKLNSLSRIREPAFTLKDNPRALKQYFQLLPKIENYCATRFIY